MLFSVSNAEDSLAESVPLKLRAFDGQYSSDLYTMELQSTIYNIYILSRNFVMIKDLISNDGTPRLFSETIP